MNSIRTSWARRNRVHPSHLARIEPLEARIAPAFTLTLSFDASAGVTTSTAGGTTTFTATATGANLSWLDIATAMASGSNVVVNSGATGAEAGNIIDLFAANKTISNPSGTSLAFESGTGPNLVGDIVLGKITLNGLNSSLRADAHHDLLMNGSGDAGHLLANATLNAATGTITDTGKIFATNLSANASSGIGTVGTPFQTQVGNIVAKTATGGIFIANTGALAVGFNTAPFQGVQVTGAAGNIQITNDASISVTRVGDFVSAPGNVTIIANGASSNVLTNGDDNLTAAIESRNQGLVALTAGQDILLGGPTNNNTGDVASLGGGNAAISLSAGRDLIVGGGSRVFLGSGSTGAGIVATAGRNISITGTGGPSGVSQITSAGGSGNIDLTAVGVFTASVGLGGPAVASGGGGVTISAGDMSISSALAAGTGTVTLQQASTVARNIDLGLGTTPGALGLDTAEVSFVNAALLRIGRIDNTGNISLTGPVTSLNTTSILLRTGGSILDGSAGEQADLIVANLTLQAGTQIGNSAADRLDINVTALSASTTAPGGQRIFLRDTAGGVSIGNIDGSGGSSAVFISADNGSITSATVDGVADVRGSSVTVGVTGAGGQIGANAGNPLEVDATTSLSASTGGVVGNDIFLTDTLGGASIGTINAGAGNIVLSTVNGSINSLTFEPVPVADVIGNVVTINVTGGASQIGAANTALQVQATTLNANSQGGTIALQQASGSVAIGQVNAIGGDVTLLAPGGPIVSATPNDGVAEVIGNVVTLSVTAPSNGNTGQIGFFAGTAQFFEVDANTLNASTNNSRLWIREIGAGGSAGVAIGSVNAGTNTAFLQVANGGNITSANVDGTPDIIADTVNLRALNGGTLGLSAATRLEINATNLNAAVQLAAGGIYVQDTAGGLNVILAQTVDGEVDVETAGADGNLTITSIIAPLSPVTLRASGNVNDAASGPASIVAPTAMITAATGIGTTGPLDLNVTTLNATVQFAGGINVRDTADDLEVALAQTSDGDITLNAAGGNLTLTTVNATDHAVVLEASNTVNGAAPGVDVVTANSLAITAGAGIGTVDPLEINISTLSATVQSAGNIRVKDSSGGMAVTLAQTATGDIHLEAAGDAADLTLANVSALGMSVTLQATGAVNGAAAGITGVTAENITITAGTGIGTVDPLEIDAANLSAAVQLAGNLRIKDVNGGLSVTSAQVLDGDIHLEAAGLGANLTLTQVNATGRTVALKAAATVNGSAPDVTAVSAGTVAITAGTGIGTLYPFQIDAPNLSAVVEFTGDIQIKDTAAAVNVTLAQTAAGDIDLEAGNLLIGGISAPGHTVSLYSSTTVNGAVGGTAAVTAEHLEIIAASGIGSEGPLEIDTVTLSAVVDLAGNLQIKDLAGGLNVVLAQTLDGEINLESTGAAADLVLANVNAPGRTVRLTATGAVNGDLFDGTAEVTAANLAITAGAGIGAVDALETAVATLAFTNTSGQVNLTNAGALTIANVGGVLTSANAGTTTSLTASGPLTFAANTSSGGTLTATVLENAATTGGVDNIIVNTGVTLTSQNDAVFLLAGDDITIAAGATVSANSTISIAVDAGNNDAGLGGTAILGGNLVCPTVSILGGGDNDFFVASSDGVAQNFNGAGGFDTYRAINVSGNAVFTDSGIISAALGNDTFTSIERVDLAGDAGPNQFDATAFTGLAVLSGGGGKNTLIGADVSIEQQTLSLPDADGDLVIAKFNKGTLDFSNLRFEVTGNGIQFQAIDLLGNPAFEGASLTVSVRPGPTGDGFANLLSIDATGLNLGNVKIAGNLGQITAGSGHAKKSAIASLTVQSLGALEGSAPGGPGSLQSNIFGKLGSLSVNGDIVGATVNVTGGGIGSVRVQGDIFGGAADFSGSILSAGTIGKVAIKGSLQGGTGAYSGSIVTSNNASIGSITVGSILGGFSAFNGIFSDGTLGTVKVDGSINGTEALPATISAKGTLLPNKPSQAMAIKSLTVGGSVRFANVLAGYATSGVGMNADVQIGAVSISGNWIGSSLAAGILANGQGDFGTPDDSVIAGGDAGIISRIASIAIKGAASGSSTAGDHFGFVAQEIGKFRLGKTLFPLAAQNPPSGFLVGPSGDLTVRILG
jgi:hypothetical protein